jgi:hypothetical protein
LPEPRVITYTLDPAQFWALIIGLGFGILLLAYIALKLR